jgi:hypothetical protein
MSLYRFVLISTLAAGFATAALADDNPGKGNQSATTITKNYVFPPVTLTSTETARVIVVNTAPPATGNNPAPSCTGTISFLLSSSATPPNPVGFTLPSGQFAFVDLPFSKIGVSTPPGEVVGKVAQTVSVPSQAPCSLGMSLVVFDTTTGVGHLILGNASTQLGLTPIPSLGER